MDEFFNLKQVAIDDTDTSFYRITSRLFANSEKTIFHYIASSRQDYKSVLAFKNRQELLDFKKLVKQGKFKLS